MTGEKDERPAGRDLGGHTINFKRGMGGNGGDLVVGGWWPPEGPGGGGGSGRAGPGYPDIHTSK